MSSTYIAVEPSKVDNRDVFHNMPAQMLWLQFVPGHVERIDVEQNIGAIVATPQIGDELERLYIPLLRGINETPAPGDSVLLCTFGNVDYYIGPLNSDNNPNFNRDRYYDPPSDASTTHERVGLPNDFPWNVGLSRQSKLSKPDLDKAAKPTHGDIMIEGRHSNSVRIGSRAENPYIIFSNGGGLTNRQESVLDGSIVAMLDRGSIHQHFGTYYSDDPDKKTFGYQLASDDREEPNRTLAQLVGTSLQDENISETIYGYDRDQLFLSSDRIVFNAKKEHIFLSANRNINIGAGEHLTLSSNNKILFDASNIYLGKEDRSEGLVLGETLRTVIDDMLEILMNACSNLMGNMAPVPLVPDVAAPGQLGPIASASPVSQKLYQLKQKLKQGAQGDFVSSKYFLESNEQ